MLTITNRGDERLDIEFQGSIDAAQMRAGLDELFTKAAGIEHGRMFYRIRDFDMPSMGAIAVELRHMVPLLRLLRRFDRIAVVADAGWVRKMSEIEGALFPGIELKAFDPAYAAEAEAWLAERAGG
jgi:hypothetical protein